MKSILHITKSLLLFLITAMAFAGCIKDSRNDITPVDPDSRVVRMHIRIPVNPTVGTRAYADTFIKTIDVLSFRSDDGTFRYRASASAIDTANEWFDITLSKSGDEQQVLVVLANLQDELDGLTFTAGSTTLAQLRNLLSIRFVHQTVHDPTHNPANKVPGQYGDDRPLPMWGEYGPVTIVDDVTDLGTIYMLRSLAAVTVLINLDMTDPEQKPFRLVDVAIYNTADRGLAIPDPDNIDKPAVNRVIAEKPTVPAGTVYNNAYYFSSDGVTVSPGIYIGERSNTAVGIAEKDRTWLVIGGIYDNSGDVTWYRLPFIDRDGKQWDILRNHNYIFNIYKVSDSGNEEEDATDANIYADVIPWNEGADEIFDIDGQYWIWIDPSSASYDIEGGTNFITVDTNFPGGVTATASKSESDLNDPCPWITVDSSPTGTKLNYTVAATDEWVHRTGYIHIRAGSFAVTVRIDQAYLYMDGITVTPSGSIPGDGENRVIRATGMFDNIPVQVWDVTNNVEITQNPANTFIPGNLPLGGPSSVTVTIPAWTQDVPRVIEIRYYDKLVNTWKVAQSVSQEGFDFQVASTLADGSNILPENQSYDINIVGTSWPAIYVRGVIRGTQTVVAGPITIDAGTGSGTTKPITIGAYQQWKDGAARPVELQWSRSISDWTAATALNYGNQSGNFEIVDSYVVVPELQNGGDILRVLTAHGGVVNATVEGTYASGWVQVRSVLSSNGTTVVSTATPAITNVSTQTVELTVGTNYNYTGEYGQYLGHRNIIYQYRRMLKDAYGNDLGWENNWTTVPNIITKQLGYVTLQTTGRVVAIEDAKRFANSTEESMLWVEAMGITQYYDNIDYPQAEVATGTNYTSSLSRQGVLNYSTAYAKGNGGCADYTEQGTTNNFYLPTGAELNEMADRFDELGKIAYAEPWDYWCTRQVKKDSGWASFIRDLEYPTWSNPVRYRDYNVGGKGPAMNRARCVRPK